MPTLVVGLDEGFQPTSWATGIPGAAEWAAEYRDVHRYPPFGFARSLAGNRCTPYGAGL